MTRAAVLCVHTGERGVRRWQDEVSYPMQITRMTRGDAFRERNPDHRTQFRFQRIQGATRSRFGGRGPQRRRPARGQGGHPCLPATILTRLSQELTRDARLDQVSPLWAPVHSRLEITSVHSRRLEVIWDRKVGIRLRVWWGEDRTDGTERTGRTDRGEGIVVPGITPSTRDTADGERGAHNTVFGTRSQVVRTSMDPTVRQPGVSERTGRYKIV